MGEEDDLTEYLRIQFLVRSWGIELSQSKQIEDLAVEQKVTRTKKPLSPMAPGFKPWIHSGKTLEGDELTRYRRIVGSCLYFGVKTREDTLYAASALARYFVGATTTHLKAALRLLSYLYHTRHRSCKILFEGPDAALTVYTDASFITDHEDCRSVMGIKVFYGRSLVHYVTKKIRVICLSTTEAEYIAMAFGLRQGLWLEEVLTDHRGKKVIDLKTDSQSAMKWTTESETRASRYVPTRYHYIRDSVLSGHVKISYVNTREQLADELTKPVLPPTGTFGRRRTSVEDPGTASREPPAVSQNPVVADRRRMVTE